MSRFSYMAVSETGQRKRGTVRSRSSQEAVRRLLEMGYHPLSVEQMRGGAPRQQGVRSAFRRVSTSDLAVVTRQMSALLKAGLPMLQTLGTLRRQCTNPRLAETIESVEESMQQDASSLSDALDEYPRVFDPVYRGLVRSGEEGGNLPEILGDLAKHLTQSARLRGQVLGAFVYPAFLLVLGTVAVFVLMTFVIPRFQDLFASFGQTLPWPTKALIAVSTFLSQWWWAVVIGVAAAVFLSLLAIRKEPVRERVDRRLLKLPVFGPMLLKIEIARIAHTLSALLHAGVPILSGIGITRETARNRAVRGTFAVLVRGVSAGESVAGSMEKAGLYPPLVVNLVRTGEDTGELPEMLSEVAAIYEDEAERAVTAAVKLLEPVLILVMGGLIAGIVAAVILPLFRANAIVAS